MPITVNFENPPGNRVQTRQFSPGDTIRVTGKVTGLLNLGEPFQPVRVEVMDGFPSAFAESRTNILGNYSFAVKLPSDVVTQANVAVTAFYAIGSPERVVIPIGIGTNAAEIKLPVSQLDTVIKVVLIGGGIVLALYAFQTFQRIKKVVSIPARAMSQNPGDSHIRRCPKCGVVFTSPLRPTLCPICRKPWTGNNPIHPQALESLKRYKADLRAGHNKAAEYWRGQAAAYFTANPRENP